MNGTVGMSVKQPSAMPYLKLLGLLAWTSCICFATAQDYGSEEEYEKLKSYASPSSFYPDGNSGQLQLLVMCIDREDSALLEKLLDAAPKFANVTEGMSGCSPVHWAAFKGNTNILGILLKHGADIKKRGTNWKISALHIAHDAQTADFLLRNGAEIEAVNSNGQTPLMLAAKRGDAGVVQTLIKHRASLDKRDKADRTALEFAQAFGRSNVAALLTTAGASPPRKGKADFPYDIAVGSWIRYGTNHPFDQTTLVRGNQRSEERLPDRESQIISKKRKL